MLVKKAIWEKRNLGLDVYEILVEVSDTAYDIHQLNDSLDCNFSVLKIPVGRIDLIRAGEQIGYQFMETLFEHEVKLAPKLSKLDIRMLSMLEIKISSRNDKLEIFKQIKNDLFNTNRYFLDPNLTSEQASNRYIGWINDELKRNAQLFSIKYKTNLIGFFIINELPKKKFVSLLAGVFLELHLWVWETLLTIWHI